MKKDVKNNIRDDAEPTARTGGVVYLPMWLTGLMGLLLYWGCFFVDEHGGKFNQLVYAPYQSTNDLVMPGAGGGPNPKDIMNFKNICAPCHQESGLGIAGQFPPLAGSEWVQTPSPARIIRIASYGLNGPLKVKGVDWNHSMVAIGAALTDEDLAGVLSYVRNAWGNSAPPVTPDMVKKVRTEVGARSEPFTQDELLKVPAE